MTPKELRALADKLEQEEKMVKVGYAKEDLYNFDGPGPGITYHRGWGDFWLQTGKKKNLLIEDFISSFALVIPKGTKFVCYIRNGKELWYDDINYGIENMDSKWAEKYLENITNV
jgi:hypothetical protein